MELAAKQSFQKINSNQYVKTLTRGAEIIYSQFTPNCWEYIYKYRINGKTTVFVLTEPEVDKLLSSRDIL